MVDSPRPVAQFDCADYLAKVLPALLQRDEYPPVSRDSIIQLTVMDRDDCDLVYRISKKGIEVSRGVSDRSDLTLAFISADVLAFSQHRLDVRRALRTSRLKIMGDETLLGWMSRRLAGDRDTR